MARQKNSLPLVGSHISAAGGIYNAIKRGESIGCTAMQIFTKSNRVWFDKPISEQDANLFIQAVQASTISTIVAHCGYLVNIGSKSDHTSTESTKALLAEANRCSQLKIPFLVLHPGAHVGSGVEACIKKIAANLDYVLEQSQGGVTILLETMAGQGTTVGSTFEQLADIRSQTHHHSKIGICLDTCHIFAAGYDISTADGYDHVIKTFDQIIGLQHLKAIHVNDSKTPLSSHTDRHAPLGEGSIPLETFSLMMNDTRLASVAKILETPSDDDMLLWKKEIALLKSMII